MELRSTLSSTVPSLPSGHLGIRYRTLIGGGRGAFLRDNIRRVVTQCEKEDTQCEFKHVLSECVCVGNALMSVNGSTPCNSVHGRTPVMQPSMGAPIVDAVPHTQRHVPRIAFKVQRT